MLMRMSRRRGIVGGVLCAAALAQTAVELPVRGFSLMDALSVALDRHPSIRIQQQQVAINRGLLRTATGQFDGQLRSDVTHRRSNSPLTRSQQADFGRLGLDISNQSSNVTTIDSSATQLFRNGISAGPVISLDRSTDNLSNRTGLNRSRIAFQVVVPLMRGRGRDAVGARENAAGADLRASQFEANHTVAQTLGNATAQYWSVIGAARSLEIVRNSEERGRSYAKDVRTLIEADRVPRNEINQLLANLSGRSAQRVAAEQQLVAAQQALAIAMGLGAEEVKQLPNPTDDLPDWTGAPPKVAPALIDKLVAEALERRADVHAARYRQRSSEAILPAVRNQLLPDVSLNFSTGYSSLWEGVNPGRIVGAPFAHIKGPDAVAGLSYRFPPRNNVALGQLAQAEAAREQAVLRQTEVARQIASNVITAVTSLSNNAARLALAREAVNFYQLALNGENEKFRLGIGSLVDVLTIEDRLTGALSQQVQAQVDYAIAITNLRFATGTFIDPAAESHTLERDAFVRPPFDLDR